MSRIHEALKKAELEPVSIQRTSFAVPQAMVGSGVADVPASTVASIPAQQEVTAISQARELKFEDVKARCAQTWHPDDSANVFNPALNSSGGAEQFRTLRSRLYQLRASQKLKSLLVTSAVPGEGKSFVTSNLAYAIARQKECRVLIIDADLRHSQVHVSFGARAVPGLSDYLRGEADEASIIQYSPDSNLCLIPGGIAIPNPSELLSNGRLKKLIDGVSPLFDWIIVDSPPSLPVADANILADFCDALLLVVRANSTPSAVVQKAYQDLRSRKIAGVVLNAVEEDILGYGHYSSHYGQEPVEH